MKRKPNVNFKNEDGNSSCKVLIAHDQLLLPLPTFLLSLSFIIIVSAK